MFTANGHVWVDAELCYLRSDYGTFLQCQPSDGSNSVRVLVALKVFVEFEENVAERWRGEGTKGNEVNSVQLDRMELP